MLYDEYKLLIRYGFQEISLAKLVKSDCNDPGEYDEEKVFYKIDSDAFLIVDVMTHINNLSRKIKLTNHALMMLIISFADLGLIND